IHSAKRWKPRQVKAQAKVFSKACQMDQVSLASVMMRLLCRGNWVCTHLASSDQETLLFNTVRLLSCCGVFPGNYCLKDWSKYSTYSQSATCSFTTIPITLSGKQA